MFYLRETRLPVRKHSVYGNSTCKSIDIEDVLLDRRIQIFENLSKLRDYQEERDKAFRMREKEYQ